jgi:hypothetical protein
MNTHIKQFFDFLEKKDGRKKPLTYKLIHEPDSLTPEGLKVGGDLYLSETKITSLPQGLKVGVDLYLHDTPLSEKYTKEEIRGMCPGIQGRIYM